MRKKLFATGGIVASIFLGASVTFTHAKSIALEGKGHSQKTYRQLFDDHGVSRDQIEDIFGNAKIHGLKKNATTTKYIRTKAPSILVDVQARALGLTIDQLKKNLQSGQKLPDIIKAQGLTEEQYHQNLIIDLKELINKGDLSGELATRYTKMIKKLEGKLVK